MITDEIVKQEFIINSITSGLNKVQEAQMGIALRANDRVRKMFDIDSIYNDIRSRSLNIYGSSNRYLFTMDIVKKLRFLDMRKLGNVKIYNKKVWGQLYVDTLPELQAGISDQIANRIASELQQDGNILNTK